MLLLVNTRRPRPSKEPQFARKWKEPRSLIQAPIKRQWLFTLVLRSQDHAALCSVRKSSPIVQRHLKAWDHLHHNGFNVGSPLCQMSLLCITEKFTNRFY